MNPGLETPLPVVALGLIIGMTYGILAVGLVLVYRSSKIINFAHGQIGAFGAAVLGLAVTKWDVPYWVMFPVAIVLSGSIAALIEVGVIRRLSGAPKLMSMVATLGASQVLLLLGVLINGQAAAGSFFPQPPLPSFQVGALSITPAYFGMLFLTPFLVAGLGLFFRFSRVGLATRAAAANPEAARLDGISVRRMAMLSWVIAGGVSAFTALLVLPSRGFVTGEALGYSLLLRALVAAVIARMVSLPIALVAGIGVGLVEQVLLFNYPVRRRGRGRPVRRHPRHPAAAAPGRVAQRDKDNWVAVQPWPPLSDAVRRLPTVRYLGWALGGAALVLGLLLPLVVTNRLAFVFVTIFGYTLVGLSVAIVTGLGGQLSLGQFALAGVGSVVSYLVSLHTGNFFLAAAVAGLVAAAASLAHRASRAAHPRAHARRHDAGLRPCRAELAVLAVLGARRRQRPGQARHRELRLRHREALLLLRAALPRPRLPAGSQHPSGALGRRMLSVRDNEDGARAFGVSATATKLQTFALAGFFAGVGGSVYGHGLSLISSQAFPIGASIDLVAMTVIGGIGVLAGPLIGSLYILGVKELPLNNAGFAATAAGWLVLILFYPGGLAQAMRPLRDRVISLLARRAGVSEVASVAATAATATDRLAASGGATAISRTISPSDDEIYRPARGAWPHQAVRRRHRRIGGRPRGPARRDPGADRSRTVPARRPCSRCSAASPVPTRGWCLRRRGRHAGARSSRARLGIIRSFQDAASVPHADRAGDGEAGAGGGRCPTGVRGGLAGSRPRGAAQGGPRA